MDRVYRNQRYIYDITRKYYLFGRDRLIRELALEPGETLAEVGCGTARNLIAIARKYPGTALYGLDASAQMLKTAQTSIGRAGLAARIGLTHGYAEAVTPAALGLSKPLNRIVFSYSLSMIPDWRGALAAAREALAPDGRIHVVDFGDLAGLPPVAARMLRAWLRQFHVSPRGELICAFETAAGGSSHRLDLLPGRYAFLLTAGRDDPILGLPKNVAGRSHAMGKSDVFSIK